jgi:taurine dioxygenase
VTSTTAITARRIAGSLGAEIHGLDLGNLDDAGYEQLRAALREHMVVFLPDQHLTPEQHIALGRRFGEIEIHPFIEKYDTEHPEIVLLRSERGMIADVWHTDVTFSATPPQFSILNVIETAEVGGDTMWSNQALVYESLAEPLRDMLLGLTAVNSAAIFGQPDVQAVHPVVRVHPETGRASLFVNRQFTQRIVELDRGASDALLQYLWAFSEQPQFNCRYTWAEGTIGIWDNRTTQHYVVNDFDGPRAISRVTILGDHPVAAGDTTRYQPWTGRNMSAANSDRG